VGPSPSGIEHGVVGPNVPLHKALKTQDISGVVVCVAQVLNRHRRAGGSLTTCCDLSRNENGW
jgi:hypothetical protein